MREKMIGKALRVTSFAILSAWSCMALSFQPTASQLEQFKNLPRSTQESLAKQYGIDIATLDTMLEQPNAAGNKKQQDGATIKPREVDYTRPSQREEIYTNDGELKPYGYNVFAGQPSTFSPVTDLPVTNNYLLAAGDELLVQLYGKANETHRLVVNRDGRIDFPKLGPLQVGGQSFTEAKLLVENFVKQQLIGVQVSVSMGELRTSQISVFGDAYQPGTYNVSAFATVSQVLKAAGGIDTIGSLRKLQVKRDNQVIAAIDLYDFLISGDTSADIRLQSGDTVFIPARTSQITVRGDVVRPALYELLGKETLASVLKNAGGVKASAYKGAISIRRKTADGIKVYSVDINTDKGSAFIVKDGDEIVATSKAIYFTQDIAVRGAVARPGVHEYRKDMRVNELFKSINSALNANTDLNYALVLREINTHRDIEVLQFNLGEAILNPSSKENLVLKPRDQLLVFSNELDGKYWYGEGQNKTREDWETEQLAKNLAEKQREQMLMQYNLAQQQTANGNSQQANTNNSSNNSNQFAQQSQFGGSADMSNTTDFDSAQASGQAQANTGSDLKLRDLEKKDEQQEVDFDSRENLLEPVVKRLIQQSGFDSSVRIVEIRGAVKFPGIYPLATNASLTDLITAGGGLRESAYQFTAELSRVENNHGNFDIVHEKVDLDALLKGSSTAKDLKLTSKDRLNIFTKPEWREDYSVEIEGEVVFPGTYTFKRGETIQDLVARAGGLTKYAYPDGAIFSRESLRKQEAQRIELLNRQLRQEIASLSLRRQSSTARYTTSPREAMAIADQLDTVEPIGRMVISLPDILADDEQADVLLENKDKIYVPPLQKVVSVIGEVQFSSSHIFDTRLTLDDYLSRAGGAKRQADLERMYVIRANGSVMLPKKSFWFDSSDDDLMPGDTIVVPIDTDYLDSLSAWTSATQILYQIGVAWNAIQK